METTGVKQKRAVGYKGIVYCVVGYISGHLYLVYNVL